ncbi:MAG: hypothetical protein HEQ23_05635 [Tepidisphaera sp.]
MSVTVRGAASIPTASVGFVGEIIHRPDPFFPNGTSAVELLEILGTMDDGSGNTVDGRLGDGTGGGLNSLNAVQVHDIKVMRVNGNIYAGISSFGISGFANTGQVDLLRSEFGSILGSIGAAGDIQNVLSPTGTIGPSTGSVISISSNKNIGTISASSINANITAGNNSLVNEPGNISSLSANSIRGSIVCNTMSGGVGPGIQCTAPLAAGLLIKNTLSKNINTPAIGNVYIGGGQTGGTIALGANGLTGVIFMGGTWAGAVTVGGTTLAPKPAYAQSSSSLGGGRVAVAPFNHYEADSGPTSLAQGLFNQGGNLPNNGIAPGLELAFYGNVFTPGVTVNGQCVPQALPFQVELVSPSNTVTVINSMVDVFMDCSDQPTLQGRFIRIKGKGSRPLYPTPAGWQYRVNIGSSGVYSLVGGSTLVPVVPKTIDFTILEDCDRDGIADDVDPTPPQNCIRWGGCAADFNMDVFIDFFDFDDFLAAYETGHPSADFNGDNFIDFFDYDAFVVAYETGCGW